MSECFVTPRILLISQWPNVKNGEYELIEKIKQTGYNIKVVDYFGFDVDTGESVNGAVLADEFDFAVSFHYDTPKFLNLPTFLWVANPLEFMHLRGDYRTVLLHHLRSYDDYLYNDSDSLKTHIRNVVGSEWRDSGLEMFPSCSQRALIPPKTAAQMGSAAARKVFYCGVNWERGIDRAGRAQGLLDILQMRDAADFYGPNKLEGISPWEGFSSYRGEIPFDGVSMSQVMREYGAVLAVSSPAHMKSRTSSSRVFEGIAAGVPVISDENPHVRALFGDLVYYFSGRNEEERAQSILQALERINGNPGEARERVMQAQAVMAERYCFEPCFAAALAAVQCDRTVAVVPGVAAKRFAIALTHHDGDPDAPGAGPAFHNLGHVLQAAAHLARRNGVTVQITCCADEVPQLLGDELPEGVQWMSRKPEELTSLPWSQLRLGEKVALLAEHTRGDYATFLTQFDFPAYDAFAKAVDWFAADAEARADGVHVGGFYVNALTHKATPGTTGILRNNASVGLYRWTQNSLAEHQFGAFCFGAGAVRLLGADRIARFDAILPVAVVAGAVMERMPMHRSRHMLLRVQCGHFHRHYEAYRKATEKGFWAQHYDLVTNYFHELNALYDIVHEDPAARQIADEVSGHALPPIPPVDPAVHAVNQVIGRLRPAYRGFKKVRHVLTLRWMR